MRMPNPAFDRVRPSVSLFDWRVLGGGGDVAWGAQVGNDAPSWHLYLFTYLAAFPLFKATVTVTPPSAAINLWSRESS